jgi:hypothetical protein
MWGQETNRHENLYRSTGRAFFVILVLWIAVMVLAVVAPEALRNSDLAFVVYTVVVAVLFIAAMVLGVLRILSYIRWTGKYPYNFLFHRPQEPGHHQPCASLQGFHRTSLQTRQRICAEFTGRLLWHKFQRVRALQYRSVA